MCFDCTAFQYQLDQEKPLEDHVFQTIFLNKKHEHTWTKDEIKKDKISQSCPLLERGSMLIINIVREDWWHQLCHAWTHYVFVVPFVWLLNWNRKHTTYAAAWTLVNAHELAIISGQVSIPLLRFWSQCTNWMTGRCVQTWRRLSRRIEERRLCCSMFPTLSVTLSWEMVQSEEGYQSLNTGVTQCTVVFEL